MMARRGPMVLLRLIFGRVHDEYSLKFHQKLESPLFATGKQVKWGIYSIISCEFATHGETLCSASSAILFSLVSGDS